MSQYHRRVPSRLAHLRPPKRGDFFSCTQEAGCLSVNAPPIFSASRKQTAYMQTAQHASTLPGFWRIEGALLANVIHLASGIYRCFALDKVDSTASNKTHDVMKTTVKNLLVAPAALVRRTAIEDEIQLSGDPSPEPSNCEADAPAAKSPSRSE